MHIPNKKYLVIRVKLFTGIGDLTGRQLLNKQDFGRLVIIVNTTQNIIGWGGQNEQLKVDRISQSTTTTLAALESMVQNV